MDRTRPLVFQALCFFLLWEGCCGSGVACGCFGRLGSWAESAGHWGLSGCWPLSTCRPAAAGGWSSKVRFFFEPLHSCWAPRPSDLVTVDKTPEQCVIMAYQMPRMACPQMRRWQRTCPRSATSSTRTAGCRPTSSPSSASDAGASATSSTCVHRRAHVS